MIELKNVSKSFAGKALYQNFSTCFERQRSYALTGPSGSGKTTLLNMLGRLERPDAGQVLIEGQDIWHLKESMYFRRYLGYVFQNYALLENQTVQANLKIADFQAKDVTILEQVGLNASYLKRYVYELSGGEAQRVAIARLMLKKPKVILADEPTGALDSRTGADIISILLKLVSPSTVLIIASHDPAVYQAVDEVVTIQDEQIIR